MKDRMLGGKTSFYRPINIKKPERSVGFFIYSPFTGQTIYSNKFLNPR